MSLTSTQRIEKNRVEMHIAVGPEELAKASERVYRRKSKTIDVPGFRKGKAPRQVIEKMYGDGIFLEDAVNDLFPDAFVAAAEEANVEPVDKAEVELLTLDKETGFTFVAVVTVKPEATLKQYKGLKAEKKIVPVTDEDIENELTKMRNRGARIITVEGRAAQNGDTAVIDFEGFTDGVAFEGGKSDNYQLELGSGSFVDTFEEQIVGHNVGDEFEVNVTFPENYHAEALKGKPAMFKVTLKELKCKELPELDDEFAKDVSEFDTLDELRADIRRDMQESREKAAQEDMESILIDEVIANLESDIPDCMFTNKLNDLTRDFEYRLTSQGMNRDLYLQVTGMDEEGVRNMLKEQADRQVRIRLALDTIAELEKIEVTPEELDAEFEKLAKSYKMDVARVRGFIGEKDLISDMKATKAIDIVRDNAVITEVAYRPEKEAGEPEASKAPKAEDVPAAKKPRKTTKKAKDAQEAE